MSAKQKVVISGSAKLQDQIIRWLEYWKSRGYEILDYPEPIADEDFVKIYRQNRTKFFNSIRYADVLFVMNEDKNGVTGYIGASTFAEMAYAISENHIHGKSISIELLKMPAKSSFFHEDVTRWRELGWIKLHEK